MKLLRLLAAGIAVGVIVIAFRDVEQGSVAGTRRRGEEDQGEAEPFLGYDGMDVDTLLDWLEQSAPDAAMLVRMREYETAHLGRDAVLRAVEDRL